MENGCVSLRGVMDRFYAERIESEHATITSKDEIKHITKVMRLHEGARVEVFDGRGAEAIAQIEKIEKEEILLKVLSHSEKQRELPVELTIYQGIPKAQKMELIIQKTTELGVCRIVPVRLERCVRRIDQKEEKEIERWERIALEASKQSKRTVIPKIAYSMSFQELKQDLEGQDLAILFNEQEDSRSLKELLNEKQNIKRIGILIGPEGGFTSQEIEELIGIGAHSVTLGSRILRTETAAIHAASVISYVFG